MAPTKPQAPKAPSDIADFFGAPPTVSQPTASVSKPAPG